MIINIVVLIFFIIAIYLTFKYRFIQFRAIKETKKIFVNEKNKSSYSAFMLSLASHMGTGNIVGISTALIYGGPGSLFWMWIFTIFSSIFSLVENTLAQVYKEVINGENRGGACYYIKNGINNNFLAILFSLFLLLTNTIFFQPLQVNTISETINITFGVDKVIILIGLVIFTYIVIFNGTRRIVRFSEGIVPIMSITYIVVTLIMIFTNVTKFPEMLGLIFKEAFNPKSIFAGGCCSAILIGFKRSLFSNEAGLGTMPSLSAHADSKYPLQQGFVSTVGIYFDTLITCSLTGFAILIMQPDLNNFQGVDLIIYIFADFFGKVGIYFSAFFMFTFAIATVVSEFYAGESNLLYIIKTKKNKTWYNILYKGLFLTGIFIGVTNNTKAIFDIVDNGMIFLGVANLYALFKLRKVFDLELNKYGTKIF